MQSGELSQKWYFDMQMSPQNLITLHWNIVILGILDIDTTDEFEIIQIMKESF